MATGVTSDEPRSIRSWYGIHSRDQVAHHHLAWVRCAQGPTLGDQVAGTQCGPRPAVQDDDVGMARDRHIQRLFDRNRWIARCLIILRSARRRHREPSRASLSTDGPEPRSTDANTVKLRGHRVLDRWPPTAARPASPAESRTAGCCSVDHHDPGGHDQGGATGASPLWLALALGAWVGGSRVAFAAAISAAVVSFNPLRMAVSPTIGLRARHLSRTTQDRRVCRPGRW